MDSNGIKRKDTTKGPPLRILSLDGGGVRGYSMLIILQELMHRTFVEMEGRAPRRREIPKPCEHFDLIVGTGTGGLIALMLGRLRLSIETCKDVYVRMTKRVFETDKTIAGIPYRSTLFKASKLEEAIKECVREHTVYDDEGNDEEDESQSAPGSPLPMVPGSAMTKHPARSLSVASRYSQIGKSVADLPPPKVASRWGNPNALLYDNRENRTKTAVTAVYKGSKKGAPPALLRSYDSRKETAAEEKCTIWQAGRATCATALAFKPIQVGQSMFLDEGAGRYNPAPLALEEAVSNEWPGREIGVFISIGTGRRPPGTGNQQQLWWEGFVSSGIGDFAEARRRLIAKIEGCEETHREMLHDRLSDYGVNVENYYRLNVEVGVGEFGMNEWNRLADISTNTRMYLAQPKVQTMNISASTKLGRIWRHNIRWNRAIAVGDIPDPKLPRNSWEYSDTNEPEPPAVPGAVELPADVPPPSPARTTHSTQRPPSFHVQGHDDDKFTLHADDPHTYEPRRSSDSHQPPRRSHEQPPLISVTPPQGTSIAPPPDNPAGLQPPSSEPPPIPPKTPLTANAELAPATHPRPPVPSGHQPAPPGYSRPPPPGVSATLTRPPVSVVLPYPDTDGPPPAINMAKKPVRPDRS